MRFEFEPYTHLPPLSWAAHLQTDQPIRIRHGLEVETRADAFVEGAWDGDFERFDFDRALMLCGSGARIRDGHVVFAAPSYPLERLFVLRRGASLFVSNSLVFLLSEADDELDPAHPSYYFDFLQQVRRGITPPPATIPTRRHNHVELLPCCNLTVAPNLEATRVAKPTGTPPSNFLDYSQLLLSTTQRLAANAATAGRKRVHRLVAACSRGYDSTATAAVASRAGCREGVTYMKSAARSGHPLIALVESQSDDSGADSLRVLGMSVAEFDRADLAKLPAAVRAEFFISNPAVMTDPATATMQDVMPGSVYVSGRHGERYWGPTVRCRREDFREVDDVLMSGHALGEFRLRASFIHLPMPYIGALHGPAIYRITRSREMDPWRLGSGYYDRPIARRLAEEAGVPREYFGHDKMGAGAVAERSLNEESRKAFEAFLAAEVPETVRRRLDYRPYANRIVSHRRLAYLRTHWAHLPLADWLMNVSGSERLHLMWNSVNQYQFHWGASALRARYRV